MAGIDGFPIVLDTQDTEEIIKTVKHIAPGFGGINLEDISAPRCFEIEERLKKELSIPLMHDDQHGTAIVVLAGLINASKVVKKKFESLKVVIVGAGAAGRAIALLLVKAGNYQYYRD
jgi:malate dehydrogenase (oxaloacetate-decarboxylating)